MKKIHLQVGAVTLLILLAALSRLLPHPYNFSPLVAMALFGGAQFHKKWQAYLLPLAAYFFSDVMFALAGKVGFYGISQFFVYSAMILITALGTTLGSPKAIKVLGYALSGSTIFFIISNLGVWVASQMQGTIEYEPGLTLAMAYTRALPFYNPTGTQMFLNAFGGDVLYTTVLFGIYALAFKKKSVLRYSKA